jgi:hypothetical protein
MHSSPKYIRAGCYCSPGLVGFLDEGVKCVFKGVVIRIRPSALGINNLKFRAKSFKARTETNLRYLIYYLADTGVFVRIPRHY